ncbi:hypothetical protein ACIOJD_09970 [Streptomyces sp. NPDC088116]|uniref:hypothetical protein n=1 Tax=Streptomyces sp. NPDC088116 TaxID=3365825 RepID=UPI003826C8CB
MSQEHTTGLPSETPETAHAEALRTEAPRADCTVDGDGRLVVRVKMAAPSSQPQPQLLLRLRPPKGKPEEITHVAALEPVGEGHRQAALEPSPAFAEGRWDAYLLSGPGAPRQRLRPGMRDLRALVKPPGSALPTRPLAVRIPYATVDGYLAVRAWLRTSHAEAGSIRVTARTMTVRARLIGAELGAGATALLRRRGKDDTVREVELTAEGDHDFSFTADYRDLLSAREGGPGAWDVFVRPTAGASRVRVARLLDDLADRKKVFVYPATTLDGLSARPYYTVNNDLAVEVTAV